MKHSLCPLNPFLASNRGNQFTCIDEFYAGIDRFISLFETSDNLLVGMKGVQEQQFIHFCFSVLFKLHYYLVAANVLPVLSEGLHLAPFVGSSFDFSLPVEDCFFEWKVDVAAEELHHGLLLSDVEVSNSVAG